MPDVHATITIQTPECKLMSQMQQHAKRAYVKETEVSKT